MATTSAKKSTGGSKTSASAKPAKEKITPNASKRFDLHKSLREHFGFDKFKDDQERIIESLLAGQDTFVISCLLS